ncbi:MAG TPA: translation initiation factor IF-2 [Candidatus Woesebacteria bacterium]|nr:translation initiation factor IF-2 [Candidatus Woesebacteria bacterium]
MVRPPIVTILGHVDHGKTSLLDYIRKSRVAAKEHGGITQRIGAYEIQTGIKGYENDRITFIDTPGHEAFSQIRSRGANVADIAILVIDAKDSIMPQTIESIFHIKNAKIPLIIAINKIDLPDANPEKVKRDLLKYEVITEDKGGDVLALPISAKTGAGIPELLESILLISADKKLEYTPSNKTLAYIIETKKDQRGVVVSAIIKDGTMKVGDTVYSGAQEVKVRAMMDDLGKGIREVQPSTPFELLGFSEMPEVGAIISSEKTEVEEKEEQKTSKTIDMDAFYSKEVESKKLSLIIKADSQGSLEAIVQALSKNEHVEINLAAVGGVHRSDIFLAKTTKSIVIGFAVPIDNEVKELAKQEKVIIRTYNIIYELLEELQEVSDIIREKEAREKDKKAEAKVLATFIIEGQTVFGCKVTKGKVNIGDNVELYRYDQLVNKTRLVSLRIRAKSVQEVKKDQECGMQFPPELDIKVGDVIKFIL